MKISNIEQCDFPACVDGEIWQIVSVSYNEDGIVEALNGRMDSDGATVYRTFSPNQIDFPMYSIRTGRE